ncbi:MAG: hypothetical protein DLM61_05220, partial [Pseudonocardiales bacterium]
VRNAPRAPVLTKGRSAIATAHAHRHPAIVDDVSDAGCDHDTRVASSSGRRFGTFLARLTWAEDEAVLVVRNRSAVITSPPSTTCAA